MFRTIVKAPSTRLFSSQVKNSIRVLPQLDLPKETEDELIETLVKLNNQIGDEVLNYCGVYGRMYPEKVKSIKEDLLLKLLKQSLKSIEDGTLKFYSVI